MKDRERAKVHLIWCYGTQRSLLSLNILREIALYLTYSVRLLGVTGNCLSLYVVPGNYVKTLPLSVTFTEGTRNCWLSGQFALFVGRGSYTQTLPIVADTFLLDTHDFSVTQQASMSVARLRPGLINVKGEVLVFGGHNYRALRTCEKFTTSMNWEILPSMSHPRCSFSPVQHRDKIYLPDITEGYGELEAFLPTEHRFEVVSTRLPKWSNCSLAVLYEDRLLVLSCNNFEWHWNPATKASRRSKIEPGSIGPSCCPAVVVEDTVYWTKLETGELVSFDLTDIKRLWKK